MRAAPIKVEPTARRLVALGDISAEFHATWAADSRRRRPASVLETLRERPVRDA
jgi:hypothetical protein